LSRVEILRKDFGLGLGWWNEQGGMINYQSASITIQTDSFSYRHNSSFIGYHGFYGDFVKDGGLTFRCNQSHRKGAKRIPFIMLCCTGIFEKLFRFIIY